MPQFSFRAIDIRGGKRAGDLDAPNPAAAGKLLESQGLVVVALREAKARGARGTVTRPGGSTGRGSRTAVVDVTRALAGLLGAGLPLSRALTAAASAIKG